jgi:hypothetical protein
MGVSNRKRTAARKLATPYSKTAQQVKVTNPREEEAKQTESKLTDDLRLVSDNELISVRARVESEMRRRNISFSVGDIGEQLVIDYFNSTPGLPNLMRAPRGTKNVDALSRNGDRYSIKTIWKAKKTGTVYPDQNNKNKQLFEFILIAQLDDHWQLRGVFQLTWKQFAAVRLWDRRMNAWYVSCSARQLKRATPLIDA